MLTYDTFKHFHYMRCECHRTIVDWNRPTPFFVERSNISHLVVIRNMERSFNDRFLQNIIHERDKVMNCICEDTSLVGSGKVTSAILNRRGVTKEMLCVWLETMLTILNNKALPLLQKTVPKADRCETLEAEKIMDQNTIIKLQSEVIKKKEVEINSMRETMQNTVKSEITSYATVLSNSCAAALAPNKISKAVKSVVDRDDRKKNVIIMAYRRLRVKWLPIK